ncbi:MAG: DUF4261 domain-containing protein [Pirellulaceae bacterium]
MPKGSFTQCVCILLNRTPSLDEVSQNLADVAEIVSQQAATEDWEFFGPSLTIAYQPEVNGYVAVDVVDRPWPDDMGDPDQDAGLFGAWALGYFGPSAFPNGLARATSQSWCWEGDLEIVHNHTAFIRIRTSYVFGESDEDAPVLPEDYDPMAELDFVNRLTSALLELDGAICCFNPNGELLLDSDGFAETLSFHAEQESIPIECWTNVRLFSVETDWALMDTMGNLQLDVPDIEAAFHLDIADPDDINEFVRQVTWYLLDGENEVNDGDQLDGPGEHTWIASWLDTGSCDPPRQVLRLIPDDGRDVPDELKVG